MSQQTHFFAVDDDLLPVFERVEGAVPLKYVQTGGKPSAAYQTFTRGADLPHLGVANRNSAIACDHFLVTKLETPITLRPVRLYSGTRVFLVDQLLNPDSVSLAPGGVWDKGTVLNGRVGSASDSEVSQYLMKRFRAAIKKHFRRVKAFWLGPKAFKLLKAGKRLTIAVQSPINLTLD